MSKLVLPVGTDSFSKIRSGNYYYIDKSLLIKQLVEEPKEVTLITRPRRFGKSLNMSMLDDFFNIDKKSENLFKGLKIADDKELCNDWMNQYPTIFVSFKDVGGNTYQYALGRLKSVLSNLYKKYTYLLADERIDEDDIAVFKRIKSKTSDETELVDALLLLSKMLKIHHNKQVIVLIDEYDVPMAKGTSNNYYPNIVAVMRDLYSQVLKSNEDLQMAVVTGCLQIAKESIFTGLNNLYVDSIWSYGFDEYFGFTEKDVDSLLRDANLTEYKSTIKEWFDGYRFGALDIYCPWDVINYVSELQKQPGIEPENYWADTSSNDVIKRFLNSKINVSDDFNKLLKGEFIEKSIYKNITYNDLLKSERNFWSVLYMTGYLTVVPEQFVSILNKDKKTQGDKKIKLRIPNKEIKILFEDTIQVWFEEKILSDKRTELFAAVWNEDEEKLSRIMTRYLYEIISYFDYKEDYYHAFLTGLITGFEGCKVYSNDEVGLGRIDVILEDSANDRVAFFEVKHAESFKEMSKLCDVALKQIDEREYVHLCEEDGIRVIKYGVTFFKKKCLVKVAK